MSETSAKIALETAVAGVPEAAPCSRAPLMRRSLFWLRANLFASSFSTIVTLALGFSSCAGCGASCSGDC
jgi:hypothetical protein